MKDLELLQRLHSGNDISRSSEHFHDYIDTPDSEDESYDQANLDHDDNF